MFFVCPSNSRACWIKGFFKLFKVVGGFKYFLFPPLPGEGSHFDKYFWIVVFLEKGESQVASERCFSRSAGTFNTGYLMTRRYPKKYELSCVFQDSSISHYYLLNLLYSHFLTSGFWLVSLLLFISYKKRSNSTQPQPPTPVNLPQFFQVPGFPKSPMEPGEYGSEVFHSALCLLAGTFRGHLRGCGTSRRSPVTWWWMVKVKVAGR